MIKCVSTKDEHKRHIFHVISKEIVFGVVRVFVCTISALTQLLILMLFRIMLKT